MARSMLVYRVLAMPGQVLREIASDEQGDSLSLLPLSLMLLALPPLFAAIGGSLFGWQLGTPQPLLLTVEQAILISMLYWLLLCFGFFSTVLLARWMGGTYGAEASPTQYLSLFTVVCAPLAIASVAHLYPNVFFNVIVMLPAVIWSMLLLYRGLPVVLHISGERGMLMASAIVGWLLVALVSLLGLSVGLWTIGIGPSVGV
jgi:hypothetical protein